MRRHFRLVLVILALVVAVVVPTAAAPAEGAPGLPIQIGLGDSWAAGVGASDRSTTSYMALTHEALRSELACLPAGSPNAAAICPSLRLLNLGVGGTTTTTLIAQQLPVALDELESRNGDRNPNNDVEILVMTIGGNDVSDPVLEACLGGFNAECIGVIHSRLALVEANYDVILGSLRAAAPEVEIVVTTYGNPIPFCDVGQIPGAIPLSIIALEGGIAPVPDGLNDVIRDAAAAHGAEVADVFGHLGAGHWVGGSDCLHPNDAGYAIVADLVVAAATS